MQFEALTIDGQVIRIGRLHRSNNKIPLLILSGFGAPIEACQTLATVLDRNIITFDVPGVGQSPTAPVPYRFRELAHLTVKLLDQLHIRQVDLLGISWGGVLAQQLCRSHPERVRQLILAATGSGAMMIPGNPLNWYRMVRQQSKRPFCTNVEYQTRSGNQYRLAQNVLKMIIQSGSTTGMFHQMLALSGWTSLHWLHRVRHPSLILMATEDPIVATSNGRLLAHRLPNAVLKTLPGDHMFMVNNPCIAANFINDFLDTGDQKNNSTDR